MRPSWLARAFPLQVRRSLSEAEKKGKGVIWPSGIRRQRDLAYKWPIDDLLIAY